ncbi:DUF4232 domain-containing protein [Streptomyces sp. M19]
MRTSRIRTVSLAAVTAALALGLTACGGSDGDSKAAGGDNAAGAAQNRLVSDADGKGGDGEQDAKNASGEQDTKNASGEDTTVDGEQCQGDQIRITAEHRFAGEQGDHLLITASNPGTEACWVTSYPGVKLGDDASVLPHSKKDNPGGDERITLQPGDEVYSAVALFEYSSGNQTAQEFSLALRGEDGEVGPYYSVDSRASGRSSPGTRPTC